MVLVIIPSTMEVTTAIAGQINLFPLQIGAASSRGAQAQQDATTGCSPFMAILQKILQANMGQAGSEQAADNQAGIDNILEGISRALSSQLASVSGNHSQSPEGADAGQNPIMAILKEVQQTNEAQAAPKELADQRLCLLQALAGPKSGPESIQESAKPDPGADETEDTQKRSIEQAILVALGRALQRKYTALIGKGEEDKAEGEEVAPDDSREQDEAAGTIAAEILTVLFLLEGSTTSNGALALAKMKGTAQEDGGLENVFEVGSQDGSAGEPVAPSNVQTVTGPFADKTPSGLDANEEITQPADDTRPFQPIMEPTASPMMGVAGALSIESIHQSTDTGTSESPEEKSVPQQGKGVEVDSSSKKSLRTDQAVPAGMSFRNEETIRTAAGLGPFDDMHRAVVNTVEQNAGKSSNDETVGQNASGNVQGEGNDFVHHAKVLYSRFQTANDGTQQPVPNADQTAPQNSQNITTKLTDKIESLLGKVEPEVVKLDASPKSQSFDKGEGDSHQLGQGLGGQGVMQRTSIETGDVSPFGSIVADRIARMTEHVAQTNRSDLTLRLKIDGSESVLLEMKERAGIIVIGIQSQDKGLVQALENQKETMIRNLETKNLNTSISITSIGEDEQDGHKERQRNRREQSRDAWNERQISSSSYFETLI